MKMWSSEIMASRTPQEQTTDFFRSMFIALGGQGLRCGFSFEDIQSTKCLDPGLSYKDS